ncbi:MAG: YigZ family protein [Desulfovibrionaceae bacterium]
MSARYPIPSAALHRTENSVRRSLFITSTAHAPSIEAARAFIETIRQEFPDATHNCWAFAAGAPEQTAQVGFSDDGEPHGTAGRPMLTVLLHSGMGELACVVTRYFGGVKLGTGGLVRAYQSAVRENLESLPQQQRIIPAHVSIRIAYPHADKVRRLLQSFEAQVQAEHYDSSITLTIMLPAEHLPTLQQHLADSTNGTARLTQIIH